MLAMVTRLLVILLPLLWLTLTALILAACRAAAHADAAASRREQLGELDREIAPISEPSSLAAWRPRDLRREDLAHDTLPQWAGARSFTRR
jgi:hypothetical protein